ncbi:hypothetical protein GIB67_023622 [Kingdonia uniflora]|uniref:Aminotransferase-like plant mobile domain-containing protein n=1 Tax=Kingdonia uniflora TaxID=39325 RepID=A0A7J7L553_9MAGN|nr:hypothetical protein GIB67_023622 [Kingdonia uniflora]
MNLPNSNMEVTNGQFSIGSKELPNQDEIQYRGSLDEVLKCFQWIVRYPTLKRLVDNMDFDKLLSIKAENSDNLLIHDLVEWWRPSTHTFHFPCVELGVMPLDFVMLTSLRFGVGLKHPYDDKYLMFEEAQAMFPRITTNDIREMIEWKDKNCIDWQPWARSRQVICPEGLKEINFYNGDNYIIANVDYMIYWRLAHPNPKIGYSLVKRDQNIWMVQNYGVEAYNEEVGDMGWFMEMAGSSGERRWLAILTLQKSPSLPDDDEDDDDKDESDGSDIIGQN